MSLGLLSHCWLGFRSIIKEIDGQPTTQRKCPYLRFLNEMIYRKRAFGRKRYRKKQPRSFGPAGCLELPSVANLGRHVGVAPDCQTVPPPLTAGLARAVVLVHAATQLVANAASYHD